MSAGRGGPAEGSRPGPDPAVPPTAPEAVVAFQGAPGAFSEEALLDHFGGAVRPLPCRDFGAVVQAVEAGRAHRGVLPVENTLAGSVTGAYDALAAGEVRIVGEIIWPIRHFLLGVPGADLERVRRILSHPVALAQCTRFLSSRPRAEAVAVYDTAGAAEEVARSADPTRAAVAPRAAAQRYGLEILARDIQDRHDNQTRFYVICPAAQAGRDGPGSAGATPADPAITHKTVVLLEVEDRPGSLLDVLEPFARRGMNLSKLESRPGELPWRYRFLLELNARAGAPEAGAALAEAERRSSTFRLLGSFVAADRGQPPPISPLRSARPR